MEENIMEQKRTMKLWQMIALVVLLAGVTISMFFPVLNPTGEKIVNSMESFFQKYEEDDDIGKQCKSEVEKLDDEEKREDIVEDCESCLDALEEKKSDNESIETLSFPVNGLEFLSKSFILENGLDTIDEYKDDASEDYENVKDEEQQDFEEAIVSIYNTYNMSRIIMGILYFIPLILIILCILSFCFKWSKNAVSIVNACVSFVGAIVGMGLYFFGEKLVSIEPSATYSIISKFGYFFSGNAFDDFAPELLGKLWQDLRGSGFLITGILFLLVLIMSIVTMAVGNQESSEIPVGPSGWGEDPLPPVDPPIYPPVDPPFPPVNPPEPPVNPPVNPPTPPKVPMGRVKCIKGSSNTKGYKFPQENKIIVGTNPSKCQLVFLNAPHVSNIHCSIRYDAERNTYLIKDHSSNGTYVNNVRLPKDQIMEYPAGTILTLADGSNQLQLGE